MASAGVRISVMWQSTVFLSAVFVLLLPKDLHIYAAQYQPKLRAIISFILWREACLFTEED